MSDALPFENHGLDPDLKDEAAAIRSPFADRLSRAAGDWLWQIDANQRFMFASQSVADILGYSAEDLTGACWRDFIDQKTDSGHIFFSQCLARGVPFDRHVIEVTNASQQTVFLEVSALPLKSRYGVLQGFAGVARDVTDSIHERASLTDALARLSQFKKRYQTMFGATTIPFLLADENGFIVEANPAAIELLEYQVASDLVGRNVASRKLSTEVQTNRHSMQTVLTKVSKALSVDEQTRFEWICRKRSGAEISLEVSVVKIVMDEQNYMVLSLYDLSHQKQLAVKEQRASAVFSHASEGMMITAPDNCIEAVNPAFEAITGYSAEEAIGKRPSFLSSGEHDKSFYQMMWHRLQNTGQWNGEIWNRRKSGEVYAQWLGINAIKDESDQIVNYIATFRDITEIRKTAEEIEYLSHYDSVTGLQNSTLLRVKMKQQLITARVKGVSLAVICLNIDGFRRIISGYGYEQGDKVLLSIAKYLQGIVSADANVTRLSADTFSLTIPIASKQQLTTFIETLQKDLRQGLHVDAMGQLSLSCCVGVSLFPADSDAFNELLRNAESAMRDAKTNGAGSFSLYKPAMTKDATESFALEQALQSALLNDEFELHFQPKVVAGVPQVAGAEALIRWRREGQLVSPGHFMPVIESSDLVNPVGEWVIRKGVETIADWHKQGIEICLSVNVSTATVLSGELAAMISRALKQYQVPAEALEIEIIENVLLKDPELAKTEIEKVRALGVSVALDDFGTGFSSLSYLQRFSIDTLKIDRSFINDLDATKESQSIVRSTIAMAHSMGIKTVAEGVETDDQLGLLVSLGCDYVQGYRIAKPMVIGEFNDFYQAFVGGVEYQLKELLCRSVLIVDDSEEMRFILRMQLEELGWQVHEAADGCQGMDILKTKHVEAVVTDYYMPNMNGVEFLAQVKNDLPNVKRVIISGAEDQQIVIEAINRAGVSGFLSKPWREDELLEALT